MKVSKFFSCPPGVKAGVCKEALGSVVASHLWRLHRLSQPPRAPNHVDHVQCTARVPPRVMRARLARCARLYRLRDETSCICEGYGGIGFEVTGKHEGMCALRFGQT
jgi:hypothetical protein